MDLLGYSDALVDACLKDKSRREIHDLLRAAAVHPERLRVCPCIQDVWVRKTIAFLGVRYSNEPSH